MSKREAEIRRELDSMGMEYHGAHWAGDLRRIAKLNERRDALLRELDALTSRPSGHQGRPA